MTKSEVRHAVLKAFGKLRKEGYLARANHLCCQNCAGYDLTQKAVKLIEEGKEVKGCIFWHKQDEQRWKETGSMYIAFGNMDSDKHGKIGLSTKEVGERVVEELKKFNVPYEWDGSAGSRIKVMEKIKEGV